VFVRYSSRSSTTGQDISHVKIELDVVPIKPSHDGDVLYDDVQDSA